jgi:hypothetical protein
MAVERQGEKTILIIGTDAAAIGEGGPLER